MRGNIHFGRMARTFCSFLFLKNGDEENIGLRLNKYDSSIAVEVQIK
ncbi:unnamed protein product [Ixodes persulcatus]